MCKIGGMERELATKVEQRALRWFGHMDKMDKYHMARRVLMAEVGGWRVPGRPRVGCMDGVKVVLRCIGMTVESMRYCSKYIGRSVVSGTYAHGLYSATQPFLIGYCVLSDRPPAFGGLSSGET